LERKHSVQKISWEQKGNESYKTKDQGHNKEQSLDHDGSKISKIMQSIQINPKTRGW
jgi:hypothetical protein